MKSLLFALIFLPLALVPQFATAQQYYAVLICGQKPDTERRTLSLVPQGEPMNSCFWNDTFLMYQALLENGFDRDHIFVLFADGSDFPSDNINYHVPQEDPPAVDLPADASTVQYFFQHTLPPLMTNNDVLVLWTFGHGGYSALGGASIGLGDGSITTNVSAETFSSWVDAVPYSKRVVLMGQCYSSGFVGALQNPQSIIITSTSTPVTASEADDVGMDGRDPVENELFDGDGLPEYHSEFYYHVINAIRNRTVQYNEPVGGLDKDGNGAISVTEIWTREHNMETDDGADPMFSDPGNLASTFYINPVLDRFYSYGIVSANMTWDRSLTFDNNITINSGVTVTVNPGVTLTFASGKSLTVNGTLNATSATFTRSGSSGTWGGIVFNSGSGGAVSYCTLDNASTAIRCNSVMPDINHCTFTNNSVAVSLNNVGTPATHLSANNFSNTYSQGQGVACYYSSPVIDASSIFDNNNMGLFCMGSSPTVTNSRFTNNAYSVYLVNNSSAAIGGMDRLTCLGGTGTNIYADGSNNVTSTTTDCYQPYGAKAVRATNSAVVIAQKDYWGIYPPDPTQFVATNGGVIYYLPGKDTPPWTGIPKAAVEGEEVPQSPQADVSSVSVADQGTAWITEPPILSDDLIQAATLLAKGRIQEATETYLRGYSLNQSVATQRYILLQLAECYRAGGRNDFIDFLNKEVRPGLSTTSVLYGATLELEALFLVRDQDYSKAMENYRTLLASFGTDPATRKNALFCAGYLCSELLDDKGDAKSYFEQLKADFPADMLTRQAMFLTGELTTITNPPAAPQKGEVQEPLVTAFALDTYPNPFNPSTTIRYSLPEHARVTLAVYDVLGRQLAVLAKGENGAGRHEVVWNAEGTSGGIYYARLVAANDLGRILCSRVSKLLLMK